MGRRLGINTHNLASLSNRTFATAALGFVLTVRDGHPTTPLVLISRKRSRSLRVFRSLGKEDFA